VIGVTVLAMNVGYRHPAGRLALAAAVLHTAALGVREAFATSAAPASTRRTAGRLR